MRNYSKQAAWIYGPSSPIKSPVRAVNPVLLKGAIVYVDVRASDGSDASNIFVDLLSQMGAQCVFDWSGRLEEGEIDSERDLVAGERGNNEERCHVRSRREDEDAQHKYSIRLHMAIC